MFVLLQSEGVTTVPLRLTPRSEEHHQLKDHSTFKEDQEEAVLIVKKYFVYYFVPTLAAIFHLTAKVIGHIPRALK